MENVRQLNVKRDRNGQPQALVRLYGSESIEAMNQIAGVLNRNPSWIFQEWIAQVHAEMVDNGQIVP